MAAIRNTVVGNKGLPTYVKKKRWEYKDLLFCVLGLCGCMNGLRHIQGRKYIEDV